MRTTQVAVFLSEVDEPPLKFRWSFLIKSFIIRNFFQRESRIITKLTLLSEKLSKHLLD